MNAPLPAEIAALLQDEAYATLCRNSLTEELDKILWDILPEIGDHAQKAGSRVMLEPLNKGETFYINRIEQAAAICRKINNPGICLMGDFYHMAKEEKSDSSAFKEGAPWLHHVHLASRVRWLPGVLVGGAESAGGPVQ